MPSQIKLKQILPFSGLILRMRFFTIPKHSTNENFPKTRRQGMEAGVKVRPFPWLSVWGNYGYISPLLRDGSFSGNDIPSVPRHKGSIGVDIDFGKGFLLNNRANIVGSRILSAIGQIKLNGWMDIILLIQSSPLPGKD